MKAATVETGAKTGTQRFVSRESKLRPKTKRASQSPSERRAAQVESDDEEDFSKPIKAPKLEHESLKGVEINRDGNAALKKELHVYSGRHTSCWPKHLIPMASSAPMRR